jgi:hypothetical protein
VILAKKTVAIFRPGISEVEIEVISRETVVLV